MLMKTLLERKGKIVFSVQPEDTVQSTAELLSHHRIGAAVVTGVGGDLVGIISERDIMNGLAKFEPSLAVKKVSDLMTSDVTTCDPSNMIADVGRLMDQEHIRHMPIVEGSRVAGVVSIRDIASFRLVQLENDVEALTGGAHVQRTVRLLS